MIPTEKQYKEAIAIVEAYELEQDRLFLLKVKKIERELKEYFETNKVCGYYIKEFEMERSRQFNYVEIIPHDPPLEECYEGRNNEDFHNMSQKHGIRIKFPYWMYHK